MSNQILFVDDDLSLLNTMKRNLGFEYTVEIAQGGEAALQVCESNGPFSVVVVDMQMPKMNGIQTIDLLRKQMPEAVFIMLTGNQDLSTAIQAVNDGRVFRFLNKPCTTAEISAAIDASQKQHNLLISEKELLNGTFVGAIKMMMDVIDMQEHQQIDTGRMGEALVDLAGRLSIDLGWEEKVVARVFMLGIAMLDADESTKFLTLDVTTDEHKKLLRKVCTTSATLISRLPRLGWTAEVLKTIPDADRFDSSDDRKRVTAVLVRAIFYWNFLTNKGLSVDATIKVIESIIPNLNNRFVRELECLYDNHDALIMTKVLVERLEAGMIPCADITLQGSGKVASKGRPLTAATVENLLKTPELGQTKIAVYGNSITGV